MNFEPLSEREEQIARQIVDAAYVVHKQLGPGLLEKVYSSCWIISHFECKILSIVCTSI